MKRTVVRYKVKPECAAENIEFIKAVFAELRELRPRGIKYASLVGEDGVTFTHIATVEGESNPLPQLEAFKAFQAGLKDRISMPPEVTRSEIVGDYGLFD